MIQRILWVLGALAWGGLTFLLGLYVTFPADAARERLTYEFGEWTRNEYALGIGDLSLWRLSGVDLDDVTFYTVKKGRRTKDEPAPPKQRSTLVHLDGLAVRVAPLSMVLGKQAVAYVAEVYDGSLDGEYAQSEDLVELTFDASDIDLSKLPMDTEDLTLSLLGTLSGEADLEFNLAEIKSSTGTMRLDFSGLGLGAGSKVAGFELPAVSFSKAGVAFEIKDGKMEVTEGLFESDTLNAELTGDIMLNKKLVRSRNRLELAFSLPEDLDKLAQIVPDLKRSRDEDGKYHMNIGGTVFSPTMRFSRSSSKRIPGEKSSIRDRVGEGPGLLDGPIGGGGGEAGELTDEERRARREERIRERRERLRKRREEAERNNPINREDGDMGDKGGGMDGEEFDPGDEGGGERFPQIPPDGGPMDEGPPNDFVPMDEGPPGDFEPMEQ